jgi:hypothetical protein
VFPVRQSLDRPAKKKAGCQSLAVLDLIATSSRGATPDSVSAAAAPALNRTIAESKILAFQNWFLKLSTCTFGDTRPARVLPEGIHIPLKLPVESR